MKTLGSSIRIIGIATLAYKRGEKSNLDSLNRNRIESHRDLFVDTEADLFKIGAVAGVNHERDCFGQVTRVHAVVEKGLSQILTSLFRCRRVAREIHESLGGFTALVNINRMCAAAVPATHQSCLQLFVVCFILEGRR